MKTAKYLLLISPLIVSLIQASNTSTFAATSTKSSSSCYGFAKLTAADDLAFDKRYATKSNFTGVAFEDGVDYVCLHPVAATKLRMAVRMLNEIRPGYYLVIFDGLRTQRQQQLLWDVVRATDRAKYVADPNKGSIHSFGFAVDLSILDQHGKLLDMGTDFDSFLPRAEPRREEEFLRSGQLTEYQVSNRKLLREIMAKAGFKPLAIEWWHFDALPPQIVRSQYQRVP